jgi:type II secretory ATPase GspE/PulE/Tfp pilus assembly ATPase PilB-like protein
MVDLGVPPYLLSSCLVGVLAQRLVRRLCPDCRTPLELTEADTRRLGLRPDMAGRRIYDPGGCEKCLNTGYRGRTGVFELMNVGEELASQVARSDDARTLRQTARQQGMRTLMEDAARKVLEGMTSREEAFRVTKAI